MHRHNCAHMYGQIHVFMFILKAFGTIIALEKHFGRVSKIDETLLLHTMSPKIIYTDAVFFFFHSSVEQCDSSGRLVAYIAE